MRKKTSKKQQPIQFTSEKKSKHRRGDDSRIGDVISEERSVLEGTAEAQRRKGVANGEEEYEEYSGQEESRGEESPAVIEA